jgi:type VII secretion-associated protein (TIGR03931 family)
MRPRSWLLAQATSGEATVVEITERFVAVGGGAEVVGVLRRADSDRVVEELAGVVSGMTRDSTAVVLVDAPSAIAGAAALATSIAHALRGSGRTVVEVDDTQLARFAARSTQQEPAQRPPTGGVRLGTRTLSRLAAAGVVVAVPAAAAWGRHGVAPAQSASTAFLVEGRVVLTVPADWLPQRVVGGPGSARVQVTSPADPEVALHVTQAPVAGEPLSNTAERLKRAIDVEPADVFIDFNPAGHSAGRPAVTYREVRTGHEVWWAVWLDGEVQISVGCQSRRGGEEAIRDVCEQAVRSAHAVG